jgi:hypothetical protein
MAYVSQEMKAKLAPRIKDICKKHGVKATLAVRHHSTLVLNIRQGSIDFIGNFNSVAGDRARPDHLPFQPATKSIDVNTYWYKEHFSGAALKFLNEVMPVLNDGNWDKSDVQTDYFNVGWYVDINIGQWDKPYALVK